MKHGAPHLHYHVGNIYFIISMSKVDMGNQLNLFQKNIGRLTNSETHHYWVRTCEKSVKIYHEKNREFWFSHIYPQGFSHHRIRINLWKHALSQGRKPVKIHLKGRVNNDMWKYLWKRWVAFSQVFSRVYNFLKPVKTCTFIGIFTGGKILQPVKIPVKEVCSFHMFFHMLNVFLKPVKTCTFIVFFTGWKEG